MGVGGVAIFGMKKQGLFPVRMRQQKGVWLLKALGFFVVFVKESLMTHPEDL